MSLREFDRRTLLKSAAASAAGVAAGGLPFKAAAATAPIIGIIYVGPRDDFGWNQAHAVAAKALKEVPGVKVVEEENVPETDAVAKTMEIDDQPRRRQPDLRHLVRLFRPVRGRHGQEISRGRSSAMPRRCGTRTSTRRTPAAISATSTRPTTWTASPPACRPSRTSSASSPPSRSPSVLQQHQLVRCSAPARSTRTPTVQVIFTGDWSLPVREAEATNALVDAGCDVITCHVDSPKVVIETAERRGVKTCGHNASQAPLAPKGFITGAEYKWETIYKDLRRQARQGRDAAELHPSAATTRTWCRTRPSAPARREAAQGRRDAAIADLKAKKPIYVGPLKDNKGKVVRRQGLRQLRPLARTDELPASRASSARSPEPCQPERPRRSGDCRDPTSRLTLDPELRKPMTAIGGQPLPTRRSARAALDRLRAAQLAEYVVIPLLALLVAAAAVLGLPAAGRQVAGRLLRARLARRLRHRVLVAEHAAARRAADPHRALRSPSRRASASIMIGGEGALVLGGFAAAAIAMPLVGARCRRSCVLPMMALAGMVGRRASGSASPACCATTRGVNETISSLLLAYIAIAIMNFFVEGALRDPGHAQQAVDHADRRRLHGRRRFPAPTCIGASPSASSLAIALYVLMARTTFGFAARVTGGNPRAAQAQGLPVGRLIVACCADRRRLRRARRLLRGRGDPGPRQCLARRRLRLHRHPRRVPGAPQPARDHPGRDPVRRHRRGGRPDPAPHGPAGRDGAGAAGLHLRRPAGLARRSTAASRSSSREASGDRA